MSVSMSPTMSVSMAPTMSVSMAPTILRTEHKFGDYISQPDLAKFQLPRKGSRPWIVNRSFDHQKAKQIDQLDDIVNRKDVFPQNNKKKTEKRKFGSSNRKFVRNINEIIATDHKMATVVASEVPNLCTRALSKRDEMQRAVTPPTGSNGDLTQDNDARMEEKQRELARDIELEQQQVMNRIYNNPTAFTSNFQPPTLMPVLVNNPAGGHYFVHLPLLPVYPDPSVSVCPDPSVPVCPDTNLPVCPNLNFPVCPSPSVPVFPDLSVSVCGDPSVPGYSDFLPLSHSSTCSSISPASHDEGFVDGDESTDDAASLAGVLDEKLEISHELSEWESEEEDECPIEQDEELNRLVLSIIDED